MTASPMPAGAAGTYLTFLVGDEEYAIEIFKVREIIGMQPITPVPGAPADMVGVISLRGNLISVISIRTCFGMPKAEPHPYNVIIIVESGSIDFGLTVDRVADVVEFTEAEIEAPPAYGLAVDTSCVVGIGKSQGRIRILLDIQKVLGER